MLRDALVHHGISGFLASLMFWAQPAVERPDLRHGSDDIQFAAPGLAEFEDYLTELDVDDDWEELQEQAKARRERLLLLDEASQGEASQGAMFRIQRERLQLLQDELTFHRLQKALAFTAKNNHWRILDIDRARLAEKDNEAYDMALKALEISRDLAKQYPFEEDINHYLLLRSLVRVQHSNTPLFFEQFKKKYARSPQAPLVYHLLAEQACEQKNWQQAEDLLKQAIEVKEGAARPYSIFRLAWVHIQRSLSEKEAPQRQQSLDKAVVALRLVLKILDDKPQSKGIFPLRAETLKDIAWIFALQKKQVDDAKEFFDKADAPLALADFLYFSALEADRSGDFKLASSTWQQLSELSPLSLELPRILLNRAEHERLQGDHPAMIQQYQALQALLEQQHPWVQQYEDRPLEIQRIRQQMAHHLSYSAQMAYLEAESLPEAAPTLGKDGKAPARNREQAFAASEELYKLYGQWYPEGSAREEGQYYKALSLYFKGKAQESFHILATLAKDEKSPLRREAAYNAVRVAATLDEKQKPPKLPALGQARKPVSFGATKRVFIEQIEYYLKLYPEAQEKAPLQYVIAQSYFEYGNYTEALPRFTALILEFPATEQGETALHTLLQYYVESKKWDVLIPLCEEWMKNKIIRAAGHRKILRQTLEYARSQVPAG